MSELKITVPLVPPSVNHYKQPRVVRGRIGFYLTSQAKAYLEALHYICAGKKVESERYAVQIEVYLGHGQKGDIDNFAKCVLDGLVGAWVIHSDAAIDELLMRKFRDINNPRTEITVTSL